MPKTFNDDEIRDAMLKTHRESYELWWRLLNSTPDKERVKSLYRYREGFDHALINLARKLGIDLSGTGTKGMNANATAKEKETSVQGREAPVCSQCEQLLFKVSKKVWNCPRCKMNYLLREE
jgi:hypothetical protein